MKKLLFIILIAIFLITPGAIAGSRGECKQDATTQTASAAITASGGLFHGIVFATDGTNNVAFHIYDNATTNSGTELVPAGTVTTSATNRLTAISISPPVRFVNGIYVVISCSGTVGYKVYWEND